MSPFLLVLLLSGQPPGDPGPGCLYGPAIQGDALANTPIGKDGLQVSCRFRADPGGPLQAIRPYLIWSFTRQGYHQGTGGSLVVELQSDDGRPGHAPSGQVLATHVRRMNLAASSDAFFPLLFFDRAPVLRAGAFYHVVFRNGDADPQANHLSLNALFCKESGSPQQPGKRDGDWSLLVRSRIRPAWEVRRTPGTRESFTPILQVDYANGRSQGMGYIECWMGAPRPIGGRAQVREIFTVTGPSRRVGTLRVRVRRLDGKAPLELRLEAADGHLLERSLGEAPDLLPTPSGSLGGCGWVTFPLASRPTLEAGRSYRLVLGCPGAGGFEAFPLRKGTDKGFSDATLFPDGHAEFNDGHGWTGWESWGRKGLTLGDLQFCFSCLPAEEPPRSGR